MNPRHFRGLSACGFKRAACALLAAGLVVASSVMAAETGMKPTATPPAIEQPAAPAPAQPAAPAAAPQTAHPAEAQAAPMPQAQTQAGLLFSDAVHQALNGSPAYKRVQLDVEISKLGEKDAWYRLLPKLAMSVSYDKPLNDYPNGTKAQTYVNMGFNTGNYDPIAAYVSLDASKLAVELAKAIQVLAVQKLMESIAEAYITMDALEQTVVCRQEQYELAQQLEKFYEKKRDNGSTSTLQYRSIKLKTSKAQMELEHAKNLRLQQIFNIRSILGAPEDQSILPNAPDSIRQIFGDKEIYVLPSFEQVLKDNIEIKVMRLKEKLKGYEVRLAQADHLPRFMIGMRTPDPTATKDSSAPYYITLTASMPIWSWGETLRRTERAEYGLLQEKAANAKETNEMGAKWNMAGMDLGLLREKLIIASTESELRQLDLDRKSIMYKGGNGDYDTVVDAQGVLVEAKLQEIQAREFYNKARLKIRAQSGEMLKEFIRVDNGNLE